MADGRRATKKAASKRKSAAAGRRQPRSAARVRKHREKMRRAGMKLLQIWVPDPTQKGFAAECRRQSLLLRNDPHEHEILAEIEAIADTEGWK
jgi:Antitoxin MazE-like